MAADMTWYNLYISPSTITTIVLNYTYNGYNNNNTLNKNASGYFDIEFPDVNDLVLTIKAEGYKDYIINYSYGMGTTSLEITMTEDFPYISKLSIGTDTYVIKDTGARASINNLATVATTGSYSDLKNKPTVNNATLTIQKNGTTVNTFTANASSNVTANISVPTKTSDLTNDSGYTTNTGTVTSVNNVNPVNGNVTISIPTVDQSYSGTSANAQSGTAVKSAIDSAISSVYKAAGSVAYASLPTPSSSNKGNVYNVTDAFTTDSRFVEGSGNNYPAGTNVVIINTTGTTYKFDVLAGMVDLSGYVPTTRTVNGKALSSNVSLTASDVNAIASADLKTSKYTAADANTKIYAASYINSTLNGKQATIDDLDAIRSGAALGKTALQADALKNTHLTGSTTAQNLAVSGTLTKDGYTVLTTTSELSGSKLATSSITKDKLANSVQDSLDKADNVAATIDNYGNIVTHNVSEFATAAQGAKAATALQQSALTDTQLIGDTKAQNLAVSGSLTQNGNHVLTTASELAGSKLTAGSVSKLKLDTDVQAALTKAENTIQSIKTGSANGTISVDGTDVTVKGLGSAAYTNSSAYLPSSTVIPTISDTYSATSSNGMSGKAVANAISGKQDAISSSSKLNGSYIQNATISSTQLANGAVSTNQLADSSVTSDKIANGTITNADISADANIASSKIRFTDAENTALRSGIDSTKVAQITNNARDIDALEDWQAGASIDIANLRTTVGSAASGLVKDMTDAKNSIESQGIRLTTAEGKIGSLETTVGNSSSGLVKDVADLKAVTVDQSYSGTSTNAQSGVAVKSAIDSAIASVYKPAGSIAYASLPTPGSSNEGYVYNISDSFTTDSRFVEGSGKTYPAGTNVVILNTSGTTYKFDVLAGMVDLSGYVPTSRTINGKALTSNITLSASDVSALPSSTTIPTITDTYSSTSSNGMSGKAVASAISTKQDAISDLTTIRSGAAAGATALQQSNVTDTYSSTGTAPVNGKAVASAISGKANSSDLATVATSGSYNDLSNKPTIPTVNNATLTIQKNGTTVNTFTANASSNVTANITVPTKTSDLTNDSGYTTNTGTVTSVNNISPVNGNVTISIPTVDQSYLGTSANAQSGIAVKSAIDSAISSVYKAAGSVAYTSLPTPSSSNLGNVYNMTDSFTTDSRFVEGSGKTYPAGTNVVIIEQTSETLYAWTKSFKDTCYTKTYPPSQGDIIYDESGNVKGYSPVYSVINNGTSYSINVTASGSSYGPYDRNTESDISGQQDTYFFDVLAGMVDLSGYVPTTRTVNGKALSSNITLTASDVSALPSSTVIPTISDTYSSTSSNGMSGKAVASAISGKANSSDLAMVATSGSYNDLSNKPTIPTVNNATLTIQKNGTTVNTFTANASSNVTANITVPTNTNELTNGAGFITSSSLPGVATTSTAGLVKPDGTTITVDANGTISSTSSVSIDEETITKNNDNELQVVAVKNKRDDSTLGIWHGTEYQWNHGAPTTWYYWQTAVTVLWTDGGELPNPNYWFSVTYGNGKFVAVSYTSSSRVAYSTDDGATWNLATLPSSSRWSSVTYGDGKFVAVAWNSDQAAYSTDGINWTASTLPSSANWHSITYGDGKFVAVAYNSDKAAYSTDDGQTWTASTLPSSANWYSITYGDGEFVIVAGDGSDQAAHSTDGINWTASTLPSSANWRSVTYGDGKFVTVAYGSTKSAISTDGGENWDSGGNLPGYNNSWRSVTYGDGKFVAVVYGSNMSVYSTDGGTTWITSTILSVGNWNSITYGNGKFVTVDYSYNSAKSAIFSVTYDKCYTDTVNPTTTSIIYSEPDTTSSYTISSVTSGAITLSNNNTYYYTQGGNAFTYRTIGDAHPEYLAFINGVGIKKGNTLIASCGLTQVNYNSTGKTLIIE